MEDYVEIEDLGTSFKVTFLKYDSQKWKTTQNFIEITKTEFKNYQGVYGDADTVLIDMAINKLFAINKDGGHTAVAGLDALAARYFGSDVKTGSYQVSALSEEQIIEMWNKFKVGEYDHLAIGGIKNVRSLGLISGHRYAIKNVVQFSDSSKNYIELLNPWDDRDCVRLTLTDFMTYMQSGGIRWYKLE